MLHRTQIQCLSCNSVILVRVQMGHLKKHPIRVHCGNCKVLIYGEYNNGVDLTTDNIFKFDNATEVYDLTSDYTIDVSGEFLTPKIQKYTNDKDLGFSPFMVNFHRMYGVVNNDVKIVKFSTDYSQFLKFIETDWPYIRRINELWLGHNYHLLDNQLRDMLPVNIFSLGNNVDRYRGIHYLTIKSFGSVLPDNFIEYTATSIGDVFLETDNLTLSRLSQFFHDNDLYDVYYDRFLKIFNSFIRIYPSLIPVLGLNYMTEKPDLETLGLASVAFDDVKNFYEECFECIGELSIIPVACNNMIYRNDINNMSDLGISEKLSKVKTLTDFKNIWGKGDKLKFLNSDELFNLLLNYSSNNRLRNAITHGDYKYDGVNQLIEYKSSKGIEYVYLSEFIQDLIAQFHTIIVLFEMFYRINVHSLAWHSYLKQKQKIGRNEKCSCGSGKKFKKCCSLPDTES